MAKAKKNPPRAAHPGKMLKGLIPKTIKAYRNQVIALIAKAFTSL